VIDSHAHLGKEEFDADRSDVLQRAHAAGVTWVVEAATDAESSRSTIAFARRERGVRAAVGMHPCDVREGRDGQLDEIESLAADDVVVAIGETGLDGHWPDNAPMPVQERFLRRHIEIAKKAGKPLVLHHRAAGERVAAILEEVGPPDAGGSFHCFAGDLTLARRVIALGFKLGVGGSATFKKSHLPELVRAVGLEHVVLETDSPYLAPMPHRGKRNEPSYLTLVRDHLAGALGVEPADVERTTDESSRALFRL
jgi:TatD DNase family protein